MSLTLNDFKQMIKQRMADAGLSHGSGTTGKIRTVYGDGLFKAIHDYPERELTSTGVDEYKAVEVWILGGATGKLRPVHSCAHSSGRRGIRKLPLFARVYEGIRKRKLAKAGRPPLTPNTVLDDGYSKPAEQFRKLQQTNVAMFLRARLIEIAECSSTSKETKEFIAESLETCQADLQRLVNV